MQHTGTYCPLGLSSIVCKKYAAPISKGGVPRTIVLLSIVHRLIVYLLLHPLSENVCYAFCGHILTVIEKTLGAFDDEPVHEILLDDVIGGR